MATLSLRRFGMLAANQNWDPGFFVRQAHFHFFCFCRRRLLQDHYGVTKTVHKILEVEGLTLCVDPVQHGNVGSARTRQTLGCLKSLHFLRFVSLEIQCGAAQTAKSSWKLNFNRRPLLRHRRIRSTSSCPRCSFRSQTNNLCKSLNEMRCR